MLCQKCNAKEATIHYTEVINGVKSQHFLCSDCAAKTELNEFADLFDHEFPFAKILSGLIGAYGEASNSGKHNKMDQVICPTCGMKYSEFAKHGKYGCADCYGVFNLFISDNIKKIQESDTHIGKRPKFFHDNKEEHFDDKIPRRNTQDEIALLSGKLKEAIQLEDFEEAVKLRDQIKMLRERNG